jgi:CheY-like chemotaxis protein
LVEDNDDIREMLRESLELSGCCTVLVARHGQEALEVLREASPLPAVIILDLAMPVMSGQEFLAVVGRTPVLASIPIVVTSAFFPEHDLPCARKLVKPVDAEQLERVICELCPSCRESEETVGTAPAAREHPAPISS